MNHDERWSAIQGSNLRSLYLQELRFLLANSIHAVNRLTELAPPDLGDRLVVNGDIQLGLSLLASTTGRLQQLLTASGRRKGESQKRHELRTRRVRWLRQDVFADIDLTPLDARGVRNALEHFDDRLDELVEKATDGAYDFPLLVAVDLALGHPAILGFVRSGGNPPQTVEHIRTYIANDASFHVLRWSFDVGEVAACCQTMLDRLNAVQGLPPGAPTDPVGALLLQPTRPEAPEN